MAQSRLQSAVEVVVSTAIGYGVSVAANLIVLPRWGYPVTTVDAAAIGVVFTAISLVRAFCVRRLFNRTAADEDEDSRRYRWVLPILIGGLDGDVRLRRIAAALMRGLDGDAAIDEAMREDIAK